LLPIRRHGLEAAHQRISGHADHERPGLPPLGQVAARGQRDAADVDCAERELGDATVVAGGAQPLAERGGVGGRVHAGIAQHDEASVAGVERPGHPLLRQVVAARVPGEAARAHHREDEPGRERNGQETHGQKST